VGGVRIKRALPSVLTVVGLLALAVGGIVPAAGTMRAAWGECADPWLTDAIWEVTGRAPEGEDYDGECDIYRYNDGAWSSYEELVGYVEAELGGDDNGGWSGECADPWLTDAIWEVTGRAPAGEGYEGECDIYRYNDGSWNSYDELVGYVEDVLIGDQDSDDSSDGDRSVLSVDEEGVCADEWLTEAIWQVTGRAPDGSGTTGECDPTRYNGGSWSSREELVRYVKEEMADGMAVVTCGSNGYNPFNHLDWNQLDYGLYWFGSNGSCEKFVPGIVNPYYDPAKPTMIYVHGWQPHRTKNFVRETFHWPWYQPMGDLGRAWLDDGWNIGIFYWNQWADEDWFWQAESKIWTPYGVEGMRWRDANERFHDTSGPEADLAVAEIFAEYYLVALEQQDFSQEVRLVGHSLGAQLSVITAWLLLQEEPGMSPSRIALLDPAFSAREAEYLKDDSGYATYTAGRTNELVAELGDGGVAVELYQSTAVGDGGWGFNLYHSNPELHDLTAYAHLTPTFDPTTTEWWHVLDVYNGPIYYHLHAVFWYLSSLAYPVHQCDGDSGEWSDYLAPSAALSTEDIAWFMGEDLRFEQDQGYGTSEVADDCLAPYYR
jgi:hypothetical protein